MSTIPPVELSIRVASNVDQAFRLFTEGIAAWWPMQTHSVGQEKTTSVTFEGRAGGEIFERTADGGRHVWGTVLVWEPPARLVFSWHPGRTAETAQEVEMGFRPAGDGTEVTLQHRGWETLGDEAEAMRQNYVNGWGHVFGELYKNAADAAAVAG